MAKITIHFNNNEYEIDDTLLAESSTTLVKYLTTEMAGEGASVTFNGTSYSIDATKLNAAKANLVAHLGTISGTDKTIIIDGKPYGINATAIEDSVAGFETFITELEAESDDGDLPAVGTSLEDCTWKQISAISAAGLAEEYFNIGDTKSVYLKGTVGTLELDTTLYVYIIGFNHNSAVEGNGITFGTFKTAEGVDVALCDSDYGSFSTDGTKCFNMNHWGSDNYGGLPVSYNYGGWSASDLRYDILGSTNVEPLNYGSARNTSDVGYDATTTCATEPVPNTLMAALPAELREVMKPMTVYTDNVGGSSSSVEDNISATVDYLPILGEYEIFGTRSYANRYEKNKQAQYEYFTNNSRVRYNHSSTGSDVYWWERSPLYFNSNDFCNVTSNGDTLGNGAYRSYGLAPVFKV